MHIMTEEASLTALLPSKTKNNYEKKKEKEKIKNEKMG
jgi:hypothetical protein